MERLLTRRQLANALHRHKQTITKWEDQGLPIAKRGGRGRPSLYSEVKARAWLFLRQEDAKRPADAPLNFGQERARKTRWEAALREQMFRMRERQLLPRDEVERVWTAEVMAVRAAVLSWPQTLVDRLHGAATLEGRPGIERELDTAVRQLLTEFSQRDGPVLCPHCGGDLATCDREKAPRPRRKP